MIGAGTFAGVLSQTIFEERKHQAGRAPSETLFTGHSSLGGIVSAYHGRLPLLWSAVVSTSRRYPRYDLRSLGKDHVFRLWHVPVRASHSSLRLVPRRVLPVVFDLPSRRTLQTVDGGSSPRGQEENCLNHLTKSPIAGWNTGMRVRAVFAGICPQAPKTDFCWLASVRSSSEGCTIGGIASRWHVL
jgi:hypothetical protein